MNNSFPIINNQTSQSQFLDNNMGEEEKEMNLNIDEETNIK